MLDVITIAGSPSYVSKSAAILEYARRLLAQDGLAAGNIAVRDLPAEAILFGRGDEPPIRSAAALIAEARGVIVPTPVYKASFSGVLKAFLDLLPTNSLVGKTLLPIATGGSPAHLLAIEYALKPVLSALGAQHILGGVYILDGQMRLQQDDLVLDEAIERRLRQALDDFSGSLIRASDRSLAI